MSDKKIKKESLNNILEFKQKVSARDNIIIEPRKVIHIMHYEKELEGVFICSCCGSLDIVENTVIHSITIEKHNDNFVEEL